MKIQVTTISIWAVTLISVPAQQSPGSENAGPLAAAIESFNSRDRSEPNEAIALFGAEPADNELPATQDEGKPVLVTGKPPKDSKLIDITEVPIDPDAAQDLPPSRPEAKGLEVRVERLNQGQGKLNPESVRLLAPFPAKPLHEAPQGWLLQSANNAPAITRQVELAPGKAITLTIQPHVLVPDADQERILAVAEPGFQASLGYEQSDTVQAALSNSIRKLNEDSNQIGIAIDQLQQLIVSLPKPQPEAASSIPDAKTPIPEQP